MFRTIGFTGNRPEKLPENMIPEVKKALRAELTDFSKNFDEKKIIMGGSRGVDLWAGKIALDLEIPVHAYLPYPQQSDDWSDDDKKEYYDVINNCEEVKYFGDEAANKFYFARNRAIVDNSDMVIAVHSASVITGGTIYTKKYAFDKFKPVLQLMVFNDRIDAKYFGSSMPKLF